MAERRPLLIDTAVAIVLFGLALAVAAANIQIGPKVPWIIHPETAVSIALLALTILPVAGRRRWPLLALTASAAGLITTRVLNVPEFQLTGIALFLCIYAAGRWGRAPARNWIRASTVVGLLITLAVAMSRERQFVTSDIVPARAFFLLWVVGLASNLAFIVLSWLLGDASRQRAEREAELAVQTEELERERTEKAKRAVVDERLRIARELHDVVAHHISVMGIQAAAARRMGEQRPEAVTPALESIEQASRDAVGELHRLLGFLRQNGEDDGPAGGPGSAEPGAGVPLPGLANLDVMRRHLADAGLALSLTTTGERRALPPAVDVSAYRILQESLTNVLKHAGVDRAVVEIDYGPDALALTVLDDGRPRNRTGVGTRSGITGMVERAALVGGSLKAGPRPEGGFVVRAQLPYNRRPSGVADLEAALTT